MGLKSSRKHSQTLVAYESPAALYDIYHWIERFKQRIVKLDKFAEGDDIGYQWRITVQLQDANESSDGYDTWSVESFEDLTIVPISSLKTEHMKHWDKIVVIGALTGKVPGGPKRDSQMLIDILTMQK